MELIPFKADKNMKEALRVVTFNKNVKTRSDLIRQILENDPDIKRELSRLKKSSKKVA